MHTDADRLLYLYRSSNKSLCSLVYFLWLGLSSGGGGGEWRYNPKTRRGAEEPPMSGEILERRISAPWHFPPARPINTALARLLHCTSVKQIPGKYELVSTCARQKLIQGPPRPSLGPGLSLGSINMSGEHVTLLSGKNHLWAEMHGTLSGEVDTVSVKTCFRGIKARLGLTKAAICTHLFKCVCYNSQTHIQT